MIVGWVRNIPLCSAACYALAFVILPKGIYNTPMATLFISVPVLCAGLYLVSLAVIALISPQKATRFLSGFANTAFAHFLELFIRVVIGIVLVLYAPQMKYASLFLVFGWVLVFTTVGLLALPWRWHHRFAKWSVPLATRNMVLFALGSLAVGIFVLLSVAFGPGFEQWRVLISP